MPNGSRIRANNVYGLVNDNPLAIGATVFNSSGLSVLPSVSTDHAVVVLDPKRVYGEPEIVVITSHAALSSSATIVRGQYGTPARAHPQNTAWAHVAINEDYTVIVTSVTRPTNPYFGQTIFETDLVSFKFWNGTAWVSLGTASGGGNGATLAYAEVVAGQTGISAATNLTGLSVTVTVPAGRRLKISGKGQIANDANAGSALGEIMEGATILGRWCRQDVPASATTFSDEASVIVSPTAGSHTYNLRLNKNVGAGVIDFQATSNNPAFILVEDITNSETPFSNPNVPVGRLGYAEVIANQTGISTEVALTGLSVNVSVASGRTVRISGQVQITSATTSGTVILRIKEGATTLQTIQENYNTIGGNGKYIDGSVILSPSVGAHTYSLSLQGTAGTIDLSAGANTPAFILVEDITPTPAAGTGSPSSTLGYAEVTANQAAITAAVDLTGLTLNVTVPSGRRIKIIGSVLMQNTGSGNQQVVSILEDGVVKKTAALVSGAATTNESVTAMVELTPTAGNHTYKLQANAAAGTSTMAASATSPAFILVEDITGAVFPAGTAVTAGLIASEAWTPWVPSVTQSVAVTTTVLTARYIKIGRIVHTYVRLNVTGAGTAGQPVFITLPVPGFAHGGNGIPVGSGWIYDSSTTTMYAGSYNIQGAGTTVDLVTDATAGNDWGVVPSIGLANADQISFHLTYEAAS